MYSMTPRQSIILAYIGLAIIIAYMVYIFIYIFSKSKSAEPSASSNETTDASCDMPSSEKLSCPPQVTCQVVKKFIPNYDDAAALLTKNLMISAKKITTEQGLDDQYYHQLLVAVYKRFYELNKTLLKEESEGSVTILPNKDKVLSLKFLEKLKTEIIQYQQDEAETPKPMGQKGGTYIVAENDVKRVLNSNEDSICTVYSCLGGSSPFR